MAEFCSKNSAIFNCIRYWCRHNVCSAFGEGHNTFYEVIIVKKSIYTKAASVILSVAAAASFEACSLTVSGNGNAQTEKDTSSAVISEEAPSLTDQSGEDTSASSEITSGENSYDRFIEGFKNAVNNPENAWYYGPDIESGKASDEDTGIYIASTGFWGDSFTYILYDMDKDGTDELFIGEQVDDQGEQKINLFGVVTIADGKYKVIAAGWERCELNYLGGINFFDSGSSGASFSGASLYKYNSQTKNLDIIYNIEYETKEDGTTSTELFEGENGKIKSNVAACKGKEAEEKFDNAKKEALKEKNELIGKEWIKVSFK